MDSRLIMVFTALIFMKTVLTEADLRHQNLHQDQLNPLYDHEHSDNTVKDQDKRTIFKPTIQNYGWAKHVAFKPSGSKYLLGYSPVDLKYAPVVRPLRPEAYIYNKPKAHFHLKRPVQIKPSRPVHQNVWQTSPAIAKPVIPVHVPPPPTHFVHTPLAIPKPAHVHHHHAQLDHVHVQPVQHIDHVHQFSAPHVDHIHKFPAHIDQVHPLPVNHVHFQPVNHVHPVPVPPVAAVPQHLPIAVQQLLPSPLFEVTKPNLGVLPFGAVFPSPVLRNVPALPAAVPLKPALFPQPLLPAPVPLPQSAPRPAVIAPQPLYLPGTLVEYHGNTNFINLLKGHVPVLPQTPVNAAQPLHPHHFHLQYPQIPQYIPAQPQPVPLPHEQHDVQTPFIPINHPNFLQQRPPQFHQQLPLDTSSHFQHTEQESNANIYHQQLPANIQTQFQSDQPNLNFFQQQLPQEATSQFQPADQVNTQQFYQQPQQHQFQEVDQTDQSDQGNQGYIYQAPDNAHQTAIQPGETDLQLPVHLPQHPGFSHSTRQFPSNLDSSQSVFRPSIQLEPPYNK